MKKNKCYFGIEEEKAIRNYVTSTDHSNREDIYVNKIKPVFSKLVENIIFRYDFLRLAASYRELHQEVMSHLYLNLDKFKPEYGKKAYSYFGTAAKRYLQQKSISRAYENKNVDSIHDIDKDTDYNNIFEIAAPFNEKDDEDRELISLLIEYFSNKKSNDANEKKIVEAVIFFLKNYSGINIHNKKHFYILIREYTGLDTKTITKIMNSCIINAYKEIRHRYINNKI